MRNLCAWSGLSFNLFNLFFFLASCFCMLPYSTSNVLSPGDSLRTWQILTSANGEFALGFFIPGNSNNRYVGIWYNKLKTPTQTIVWVANRDDPLTSSSGKFTLTIDGNLAVLDGSGKPVWQRNDWTGSSRLGMLHGELLDSGNLVLRDRSGVVWQSFDYPTDTLLPGMRIRKRIGTPNDTILRSWKIREDPGSGSFSFRLDLFQKNELFIMWGSKRYWQSGVWNGMHFEDMEYLSNSGLLQFDFNSNSKEKLLMYSALYNITRLVMDFSGQLQFFMWNDLMEDWRLIWSTTWDCTGACGPNSSCNNSNPSICKCLPGFKPWFSTKWNSGIWSHGCRRKTGLDCKRDNGFKILSRFSISSVNKEGTEYQSAEQCNATCRDNCNCSAWSYSGTSRRGLQEQRRLIDYSQINRSGPGSTNIGGRSSGSNESVNCWIWEGNLLNVSEGAEDGGIDLYLRIPASESGNKYRRTAANKALNVIIMVTAIIGMAFLGTFIYCLWRLRVKKKATARERLLRLSFSQLGTSSSNATNLGEDGKKGLEIPFIQFGTIIAATDNFSNSNKLGQGGFGPVYKGKLHGGQEIAVKRLSKASGQGLEEFKNEVILIAKLQHRNLVRLLGYCIHRDEKILLYEFMQNKSLDSFLFDQNQSKLLDWEKRFTIILGVARGLLYLHQDSRLRIIHRDLKTSNILLDEEMNPKISDFGLARIFGGNQTEANTNRVVGTYGYMSPEYALDGIFSVKSDVFSFGVVLLEIISGKKNTGFYNSEQSLSLLGHAWNLWKEDKGFDLMDPKLKETCNKHEVLKCIYIGLLCVQEDANDRPAMASIVAMLVSENAILPTPKQPAFFIRGRCATTSSSSRPETCSKNEVTISTVGGR